MSLPAHMQAVEITTHGGPEVLKLAEVETPQPRAGEVLIRVRAAGVNRPDVSQRAGAYPPPPDASPLPGLEIAGEIVALGEGVTAWSIGDEICALTPGGGYAQYCRVPAGHCLRLPQGYDMIRAAALPETFFTVYYNIFNEKCQTCLELGADLAINYKEGDWAEQAAAWTKDMTGGPGLDVILDMVGGPYINPGLKLLRRDGRYNFIAFLKGPKAEVDFSKILMNRLTVLGATLRPQTIAEKTTIAENLARDVWPLLDSGKVAPVIHKTFPLKDAAEAHRLMETSSHIGKIMMEVD